MLEAFPMDKLSESVARFGRRCRAQVSPLSAFLNLQCAPFGAIFNVARPGSQVPVADVLDQRQRITLPPAMILTGRPSSASRNAPLAAPLQCGPAQ